ncbi:xanthine hydroxylase reductase [Stutzerimonas kirkiae]|uniref:Xanthine hydroxylase reductase n=1 Tax=Stutzerimonas kirkiae TaxID=2211392 RepID=A0A4V2KCZ5_9GAMM|nr:PDR/VanB family oxidoreductase [Stutzerimonas kirkiae]TBU96870.1 xanthine hydroxylase reductase [Stutzerimonas kirkiae]TBV00532.1 xanthine hydroxylase reductase [Stutzerimonas kirkiae]
MVLQHVTITETRPEGLGNQALRLEPTGGELQPFEAGAHVDVHLPNGLVRQYSIASAPHRRDHYLLCVKHEAQSRGGSQYVCEALQVGTELRISAPRNLFPLHAGETQVLVGAGIGLTPLLAMAESLECDGRPFVLHHYSRAREQVPFLERLLRGFSHGRVYLHHSRDGASPRQHIPREISAPPPGGQLYLCGPEAFMQRFGELALEHGWAAASVHREAFGGTLAEPPAEGDEAFEVLLASSGRLIRVEADRSIAAALLEAGVDVPLSCEMGICGACTVEVLEGTPEHRDSVLSEQERTGHMTLCCSRSRSARLTLNL